MILRELNLVSGTVTPDTDVLRTSIDKTNQLSKLLHSSISWTKTSTLFA